MSACGRAHSGVTGVTIGRYIGVTVQRVIEQEYVIDLVYRNRCSVPKARIDMCTLTTGHESMSEPLHRTGLPDQVQE